MIIRKFLSLVIAVLICFSSFSLISFAEDDEGFMPTLPPCEDIEISIVYRPLRSFVSFAGFGPFIEGTILKIIYSDGSTEKVKIEKAGDEPWDYVAGDYYLYLNFFNTSEVKSPGVNYKKIVLDGFKNDINYSGVCNDFAYLYIPSPAEMVFMFYYALRSIFNPIIEFHI